MSRTTRTTRPFRTAILLTTAAMTAPACGDLVASDDPGEPIAVVTGTLLGAEPLSVEGELRLAILWGADVVGGYTVAGQVAELESTFPAGFRILLREPPPAASQDTRERQRLAEAADECQWHLDELLAVEDGPASNAEVQACVDRLVPAAEAGCAGVASEDESLCRSIERSLASTDARWAVTDAVSQGTLVAFDDRNGNGVLDLVPPGGHELIDRILWIDPDHMLAWREGQAAADQPPVGFSVLSLRCAEGAAEADDGALCPRWHGAEEPLTLTLAPTTIAPRRHCSEVMGGESVAVAHVEAADAAEAGFPAGGQCSGNGLVYEMPTACEPEVEGDLCGPTRCTGLVYSLLEGEPAPAGWPCRPTAVE